MEVIKKVYVSESGVEFDNQEECDLSSNLHLNQKAIHRLNSRRSELIAKCKHRELVNETRNKMVRSIIRGDGETVGEEYYKTHGFCKVCKSQVTRDEDTGAVNVW